MNRYVVTVSTAPYIENPKTPGVEVFKHGRKNIIWFENPGHALSEMRRERCY